MHAQARPPRIYVFSFPRLDTAVEVATLNEGVVIRASRDTFSPDRKTCFLRELAAEGFIPDEYASPWPGGTGPVRWIVDAEAFMPAAVQRTATHRFMLRLFVSVAGLWLALIAFLLLHSPR